MDKNLLNNIELVKTYTPPLRGTPLKNSEFLKTYTPPLRGTPLEEGNLTYNGYKSLPKNINLREKAKNLRKSGNLSEVLIWQQVKNKKILGLDFDRQKIVGDYIVDFFVKSLGLIVEIDGSSHEDKIEYDQKREAYLKSFGLKIFRITDFEVKNNLSEVIEGLMSFIKENY